MDKHEARVQRKSARLPLLPWPCFGLGCKALARLQDAILPPPQRISDLTFNGFALAEAIRTLTALRVPDALQAGPLTAEDLGQKLGVDSSRLKRLLLMAAESNVFELHPASRKRGAELRFRNTRLSATLCEDHPYSQRYAVLTLVGMCNGAWNELEWGLRTGGVPHEKAYEAPFFKRLQGDAELEDVFSRGMKALDATLASSLLKDYPWKRHRRFLDIGGAYGSFLALLLDLCPRAEGVLFDLEQVIARARQLWREDPAFSKLQPRVTFKEGSFFEAGTLPALRAGDALVLRQILHDWDDKDVLAILRTLRAAVGATSDVALLLVEMMPSRPGSRFRHNPLHRTRRASDIHMLCAFGGTAGERDREALQALLEASGFRLQKVHKTRGLNSVVVAVPDPAFTVPAPEPKVSSLKGSKETLTDPASDDSPLG